MALFENFPYTNIHELNLDWIINELKKMEEAQVISVNGMTGRVILYEDAQVILPEVNNAAWSFFRTADGVVRGITFREDGNAYIMNGNAIYQLYTTQNAPDFNDQYVQLGTLTDEEIYNWNIFREINGSLSGIQFDTDGTAYIMSGSNRFKIYSQKDDPPYPVTSIQDVAGGTPMTGNVVLFRDSQVRLPDLTGDEPVNYWNLFRYMNNGFYGLEFQADGDIILITPGARSRIYTALNPPPYPVTSVNNQTGAVQLNIPPDFVVDLDDDIMEVNTDATSYQWGLVRQTNAGEAGSIGIMFDNQIQPHAYLRYFDTNTEEYVTRQLLTNEDIPSGSGVVSVNGLTGAVVLTGSDIRVNPQTTETADEAITRLEGIVLELAHDLSALVEGNTCSIALTKNHYVIVRNSTISGISDGIYRVNANIPAYTAITSANLYTITSGGLNDLFDQVQNLIDNHHTDTTTTATGSGLTATFKKRDHTVMMSIATGTASAQITAGTTILTVPAGLRPMVSLIAYGVAGSTDPARFTLHPTNGHLACGVTIQSGAAVRLTCVYMTAD